MRKLLLAFLATLCTAIIMRIQGDGLVVPGVTPLGIVDLEFCSTAGRLAEILAAWDLPVARWNILIDFLFLASYGAVFYYATKLLHNRAVAGWHRGLASFMCRIAWIPSILDGVENSLMLITLEERMLDVTLLLTPPVAMAKFALAAILVLYLLVSLPLSYAISKKTTGVSE